MSRSASDLARPVAASYSRFAAAAMRTDSSRASETMRSLCWRASPTIRSACALASARIRSASERAWLSSESDSVVAEDTIGIRVRLGLVQQRVAGVEDILSVVQLTWDRVLDVVDQFEHVTTRDHAARGHRYAASFLDNGAQFVERLKNSVHGNTLPASLLLPVCLVLLL